MLLNSIATSSFLQNLVGANKTEPAWLDSARYIGLLTKMPGDAVYGVGEVPSGNNLVGATEVATPNTTSSPALNNKNYRRYKLCDANTGTGTGEVEHLTDVMSSKYMSHSLGDTSVPASSYARRIGNVRDIVFNQAYKNDDPDAVTGADWGTIVGFAVYTSESSTADSFLFCGKLEQPVTIETHDVFLFRIGCFELISEEDGSISSIATGLANS